MSVIIRLQRLPWTAAAADLRAFFVGLSIPEGGVHIVGGREGDAFIAFSTDEDARQAMAKDGRKIKDTKVKLLLSSRVEMQKVIEKARHEYASGAVPPPQPVAAARSPSPPPERGSSPTCFEPQPKIEQQLDMNPPGYMSQALAGPPKPSIYSPAVTNVASGYVAQSPTVSVPSAPVVSAPPVQYSDAQPRTVPGYPAPAQAQQTQPDQNAYSGYVAQYSAPPTVAPTPATMADPRRPPEPAPAMYSGSFQPYQQQASSAGYQQQQQPASQPQQMVPPVASGYVGYDAPPRKMDNDIQAQRPPYPQQAQDGYSASYYSQPQEQQTPQPSTPRGANTSIPPPWGPYPYGAQHQDNQNITALPPPGFIPPRQDTQPTQPSYSMNHTQNMPNVPQGGAQYPYPPPVSEGEPVVVEPSCVPTRDQRLLPPPNFQARLGETDSFVNNRQNTTTTPQRFPVTEPAAAQGLMRSGPVGFTPERLPLPTLPSTGPILGFGTATGTPPGFLKISPIGAPKEEDPIPGEYDRGGAGSRPIRHGIAMRQSRYEQRAFQHRGPPPASLPTAPPVTGTGAPPGLDITRPPVDTHAADRAGQAPPPRFPGASVPPPHPQHEPRPNNEPVYSSPTKFMHDRPLDRERGPSGENYGYGPRGMPEHPPAGGPPSHPPPGFAGGRDFDRGPPAPGGFPGGPPDQFPREPWQGEPNSYGRYDGPDYGCGPYPGPGGRGRYEGGTAPGYPGDRPPGDKFGPRGPTPYGDQGSRFDRPYDQPSGRQFEPRSGGRGYTRFEGRGQPPRPPPPPPHLGDRFPQDGPSFNSRGPPAMFEPRFEGPRPGHAPGQGPRFEPGPRRTRPALLATPGPPMGQMPPEFNQSFNRYGDAPHGFSGNGPRPGGPSFPMDERHPENRNSMDRPMPYMPERLDNQPQLPQPLPPQDITRVPLFPGLEPNVTQPMQPMEMDRKREISGSDRPQAVDGTGPSEKPGKRSLLGDMADYEQDIPAKSAKMAENPPARMAENLLAKMAENQPAGMAENLLAKMAENQPVRMAESQPIKLLESKPLVAHAQDISKSPVILEPRKTERQSRFDKATVDWKAESKVAPKINSVGEVKGSLCLRMSNLREENLRYAHVREFFRPIIIRGQSSIKMIYDRKTGQKKNQFFVRFNSLEDACRALAQFQGKDNVLLETMTETEFEDAEDGPPVFSPSNMDVRPAPSTLADFVALVNSGSTTPSSVVNGVTAKRPLLESQEESAPGPFLVLIDNAHYRFTDRDIEEHFGRSGSISKIVFVKQPGRNPTIKVATGKVFVEFSGKSGMEYALSKNGAHIAGRTVNVSLTTADKMFQMTGQRPKSVRRGLLDEEENQYPKSRPPGRHEEAPRPQAATVPPMIQNSKPAAPVIERDTCVRVTGCPKSATTRDVAGFLDGLSIVPVGGVHVVGDAKGTAYVELKDPDDVIKALNRSTQRLRGQTVTIRSCPKIEMEFAAGPRPLNQKESRRPIDQPPMNQSLVGPPPGYPPIDPAMALSIGKSGCVVALHNLPSDVTLEEICELFSEFNIVDESVRMHYDPSGQPTGDCLLALRAPPDAMRAVQSLNKRVIRTRTLMMYVVPC